MIKHGFRVNPAGLCQDQGHYPVAEPKVTGGPCKVISRPAAVTHGGLGIKASEFNIVVAHLVDSLNKFKVPAKEQKELLTIIGTVRPDIVEVEDERSVSTSAA